MWEFSEPVEVIGGGDVRLRLHLSNDDANAGARKVLRSPTVVHGGRTLRFAYDVLDR